MKIKNSTTLQTLLSEYPQAEGIITKHLPDFNNIVQEQLKSPVLKITTVEHIALKAGIEPSQLIKQLAEVCGLSGEDMSSENTLSFDASDPDWIQADPSFVVDGVALLSKGEHPLELIKSRLDELSTGEVILLTTNFHPQPMIDAMKEKGAEVFSRPDLKQAGLHRTFIKK